MTEHTSDTTNEPTGSAEPGQTQRDARPSRGRRQRRRGATGEVHLLFGSAEDLCADLLQHGGPDDHVVRIERLVRSDHSNRGGTSTLGIAVTARRADEVLSCWVVVSRLSLDPWGQPLDAGQAKQAAERHHDAQHLIGAVFADAGFAVRLGLYLLPEGCYAFAATSSALDAVSAPMRHPRPVVPPQQGEGAAGRERAGEEDEHRG